MQQQEPQQDVQEQQQQAYLAQERNLQLQQQQAEQELTRSQQEEENRLLQMQQEQLRQQRQQEERLRQQIIQQEQQPAMQIMQELPEAPADAAVAYTVRLETTVGVIDIIIRPDWAPLGARRFLDLVAAGDLNDLSFYRAIEGCIAQFGLPAKRKWDPIPDDPPTGVPFLLGAVSFAAVGENSRKSTLFICTGDMSHCLGHNTWETPIGAVAESSLDVLDRIDTTYGDIAEFTGSGPDTSRINAEGETYLRAFFPRLTYIQKAWPLDWEPENPQDVTSSPSAAAAASGIMGAESTSMNMTPGRGPEAVPDQALVAARAAEEAQEMAARAAHLAATATTAEHAQAAIEAAQNAKLAAQQAQEAAALAQAAANETRRRRAAPPDVPPFSGVRAASPEPGVFNSQANPAPLMTTGQVTAYAQQGVGWNPPTVKSVAQAPQSVVTQRAGSSMRISAVGAPPASVPVMAPQGVVAVGSRQVSQVVAPYPKMGQVQQVKTQPVIAGARQAVGAPPPQQMRFTQQVQSPAGGSVQFSSKPAPQMMPPGAQVVQPQVVQPIRQALGR